MQRLVFFNLLLADIGVAIAATVPARVVFANVHAGNTPATFPLIFIFGQVEFDSGQF